MILFHKSSDSFTLFVLVTFRPHRPLSTFDKIALRQTGSKDSTSSTSTIYTLESILYLMTENKGNETYMKKTEGKTIKVDKSPAEFMERES